MKSGFGLPWPLCFSLSFPTLLTGLSLAAVSQDATAPTRAGDEPEVSVQNESGGTLRNRQITVRWQISDGHLTSLMIQAENAKDRSPEGPLLLDGPFTIILGEMGS